MSIAAQTAGTSSTGSEAPPEGGPAPATPTPPAGDGAGTPPAETDAEQQNTDPAATPGNSESESDRLARLETENARLRRENASDRVNAKQAAADAARDEFAQAIGKALGLVTEGDEAPTVESLTASLTEQQAATTSAEQRAAAAETKLAVYLSAPQDVDATRLLKFTDFLDAIRDIESDDTDGLQKAITDTVAANPWLRTQAVGPSSADIPGGSGEGSVTQEQFDAMSNAEKAALHKRDQATYRRLAGHR